MRKKIVVKLLAVVMAMTMVLGSGMTVFAAESLTDEEADTLFAEHIASCTHASDVFDLGVFGFHQVIVEIVTGEDNNKYSQYREYFLGEVSNGACSYNTWEGFGINEVNVGDIIFGYYGFIDGTIKRVCNMCQAASTEDPETPTLTASTPKVTPEQLAEEAYNAAYWANQATMSKEAALPVSTFTSEGAVNAIPAEAKASGAAYNLSAVTSSQGFAAAVNKLSAETTNATLAVYSSKMITFTSELLEEIEKTGKTFEYSFELEGHIYKITIPAGAKVDMDGQRFVGPLYIGAQLGTSQVIK